MWWRNTSAKRSKDNVKSSKEVEKDRCNMRDIDSENKNDWLREFIIFFDELTRLKITKREKNGGSKYEEVGLSGQV